MNSENFGYEAIDYDIQNEFNETDVVIDLFKEIEKAYNKEESIFDNITEKDMILAFFPCVRFENQIELHFRGTAFQQKKWTDEQKLENDLKLHRELDLMYETITKLAIVCIRKNLPLIIENPYSTTHYLVKYWAIPSKVIDKDRTLRGDYYEKPTQYWFINCEPKYNMIFEAYSWNKKKSIGHTNPRSKKKFNSTRIRKQIYKRIYSRCKGVNMKDIELKIIVILVVILWAVMFFITGIRLINWQNEYNNKDEQIKILEQSLNEQLQEKEVYMKILEQNGELINDESI